MIGSKRKLICKTSTNSLMNRRAFILITDLPGGAENLFINLHLSIIDESQLLYLSSRKKGLNPVKNSTYFSKTKSVITGAIRLLFNHSFLNQFEIIYSTHLYVNAYLGFLKKLGFLKVPILVFRESTSVFLRETGFKLYAYKIAYKYGYGKQQLIITQTNTMLEQLVNNINLATNWKIKTIPNPINLAEIQSKALEFEVEHDNYIIAAGRLIHEKGFDNLIHAYSLIHSKIGNRKLLILGDGDDREKLTSLINHLGLNKNILLLGYINNPIPYFKNADLCIISSRVEGFPNVLLQMMAVNGNVISTECAGGIPNIEGLHTCPPGDVSSLSEIMYNALTTKYNNIELFKKQLLIRSIPEYWSSIEKILHEGKNN